jgi:hypothetical protein
MIRVHAAAQLDGRAPTVQSGRTVSVSDLPGHGRSGSLSSGSQAFVQVLLSVAFVISLLFKPVAFMAALATATVPFDA